MKIAFIGAVEFSRRTLSHLLISGVDIVGVCTLEASAANSDHADLGPLCTEYGVDYRYSPDINNADTLSWISSIQPDVIFCFGWSRLLKKPLLELAPLGVVGFHPARLPANRGRHPLIWALVLGLSDTANTFFFMNENADAGDIVSQESLSILRDDNATSLYERMINLALTQLDVLVPELQSGIVQRVPQDSATGSTWRKRTKADGVIDWRMCAENVHNLVRALTKPYVGAHFMYQGREVKVWKTSIVGESRRNIEPGKVLSVNGGALVKCGSDAILLLETEPAFAPSAGEYL